MQISSFVGIDVSKTTLDIHILPGGHYMKLSNDATGHGLLIKHLHDYHIKGCAFEATGHYSRDLHKALEAAGLPASKLNPRQASFYIKSHTPNHKTDKSDAAALAHMAQNMNLPTSLLPSSQIQRLQELVGTKQDFMTQRTALKNRIDSLTDIILIRQTSDLITQLSDYMKEIDVQIEQIIKGQDDLKVKADILQTIPGIGKASAFAIIALMPEIGSLNGKQAAALLGVAPLARDSGTFKGRRTCRGGRSTLRTLLYLPTMTATRTNKTLALFYARLRKNGKSHKTALIATMRKLTC